jgi:hypothetical protein
MLWGAARKGMRSCVIYVVYIILNLIYLVLHVCLHAAIFVSSYFCDGREEARDSELPVYLLTSTKVQIWEGGGEEE